MKTDQEIVSEFIKQHPLAVLSTVTSDALPEAAVVGIHPGDNFEIIFGTFRTSRKYANLEKNPRVALVIGWDKGKTVQYEGEAKELPAQAVVEFEKAHMGQMSSAAKYASKEDAVFYKITPRWVRYTDASKDPWDNIEIRF
jgi:pyridoxine/pyridoxamine 5'-phosphate oxidase